MELSKTKTGVYSSLSSARMRRRHGLFIVEGEKSVRDTLGHFELECLICLKGCGDFPDVPADKVREASEADMKKISGLQTVPPVVAVYRIPRQEERPADVGRDLYLVLDGVQDPGNLGTIVRTCHWFGIRRIFASRDTADVFNPKCVQSTMGSIAKVEVTYCDLPALFRENPSMPVYGLLLDGKDIFRAETGDCGFIVMGNEGNGISPEVRSHVTSPLLIPPATADHAESLNVAVATAITLARFRGK